MRHAAGFVLGVAFVGLASTAEAMVGAPAAPPLNAAPVTKVEYFCSPGFEPSYGGTCVAVAPRAEIELFVDQPIFEPVGPPARPRVRRRRHHGISERY